MDIRLCDNGDFDKYLEIVKRQKVGIEFQTFADPLLKNVKKGLRAKFMQNQKAADLLKSTGDAVLIKSCPVCYKCGFGTGSDQNRMGKILMKIRQELLDA